MKLAERKELGGLLETAGKSDVKLAVERMNELVEEQKFDAKETKLYLSEMFTEDSLERMSWLEKLGFIMQGLHEDLVQVNYQVQLNALRGTAPGEEIKALREKRIESEKRRLKKEEETVQNQQDSGILPPGSVKHFREMREEAGEYGFHPESPEEDTKFVKLSEKQLSDKKEFLEYRLYERGEELDELRTETDTRQKEHAKEVLERIGPREYPT